MNIAEFEKKLNGIRAKNGWKIEFELSKGIWIITVFDKYTSKQLGQTGAGSLDGILPIFDIPFDKPPWV
jgi:hypothetical protein